MSKSTTPKAVTRPTCLVCGKRPRKSARSATCSAKCQKRWAKFMATEFARYQS